MGEYLRNKIFILGVGAIFLILAGFYFYYNSETQIINRLAKENPKGREYAKAINIAKERLAKATDRKQKIEALLDIAVAKDALGDINGAIKEYEKILAIDPTHNIARNNLASIYIRQGNYEKAETEYLAIIATQPHLVDPYLRLADLYEGYLKEKTTMVPAVLTYAINQNGKQPAFLERLIEYYFDNQIYTLAAEQADELLKIDPQNEFAKDVLERIKAKS